MGLVEQFNDYGFSYTKSTITFPGLVSRSMGADNQRFASSYIILGATSTYAPTRIRLYSTSASLALDEPRVVSSFNISASVGLNTEIYFDVGTSSLQFDPPIIGTSLMPNGATWYNISSSQNDNQVTFDILNIAPTADSTVDRQMLSMSHAAVPITGNGVSGSIATPKSLLLLSGSATVVSRLRLYSVPITQVTISEASRSFGTTPANDSRLIVDIMFDSASAAYPIKPVLQGFTWNENEYTTGTGVMGYILQNNSGAPATISASIAVYSLED